MLKTLKAKIQYQIASFLIFFHIKKKQQNKNVEEDANLEHITSTLVWPKTTACDCELFLKDREVGSFLVRQNCPVSKGKIDISYKRQDHVAHMKIDFDKNSKLYSLDLSNEKLPKRDSIDGLINCLVEKCKDHSLVVTGDSQQSQGLVKLKFPVTRNITLMHHCKKAIYEYSPGINVNSLLAPTEIKEFLKS